MDIRAVLDAIAGHVGQVSYVGWLVPTVVTAVFLFATWTLPKIVVLRLWDRVQNGNIGFQGYLYHRATANVAPDVLRRTELTIRLGFVKSLVARQINTNPRKIMYSGAAHLLGEAISIQLKSPKEGQKLLNIYKPRKIAKHNMRWSAGYMSGLNQDGDPWTVGCILVSRKIPVAIAWEIISSLDGTVLTKAIRHSIEDRLEALSELKPPATDRINHPWGSSSEQ